jgi:hypothetical protein
MTIISLLDLPLTLADGQARDAGLETLTNGLPQYLSRCKGCGLVGCWRVLIVTRSDVRGRYLR